MIGHIGIGAAALALVAGHAMAGPAAILARPDGDFAAWQADHARCHEVVGAARIDDLPVGNPVPGGPVTGDMSTVIGASIAFAIVGLIETDHQRRLAETLCLRNLGYGLVRLTPQEDETFRRQLSPESIDHWREAFLAQDLKTRLAAALTPVVPRLPAYRDAPYTQGGLKVDAASLAAPAGPVEARGLVLAGKATRWRTAALTQPFQTQSGFIRVAGVPGAVFYQVDMRPQREPLLRQDGATWCGPVTQSAPRGAASVEVYCFAGRDDGYEIYQTSGYDWFGGAYGQGFTLPRFTDPIVLRERDADDLPPMDFTVRAATIKARYIDLEATVARKGSEVVLWSRRLKFDATGAAVLPLWDRRLVLTRLGADAVAAALDSRGDGRGWREGDQISGP